MNENELIQEILQRLTKLETLLETKLFNTDQRLKKLEDNNEWLWRTLVGAVIAAAVAIYLK